MHKISPIYIAFGANLSNPRATFLEATASLQRHDVRIEAISGLWQSPAWPAGSEQPDYINAVARAEFDGSALELLAILHRVEAEFGRIRDVKNAARPLDLDLIDFKGEILNTDDITIPHPRMMERGFVLFPLSELTQTWRHPETAMDVNSAIARLPLGDVAPMMWLGRLT